MSLEFPFTYPKDIPAAEVIDLLAKHEVEIDAQTSWCPWPGEFIVTGNHKDLIDFFTEIDGPGQSFPIDEFNEMLAEYNTYQSRTYNDI